jgi:CheY-like chemotaxis protein
VLNLVVNARDAMADGGLLAVEVGGARDLRALPNELDPRADYALVTVSDSGTGMPESVRARVFDPYFSTKQAGHGLGLATVQGIVQKAGGAITVTSEVGKGTTFRVYLPRVAAAAKPEAAPAFSGRILLLDDQEVVRRTIGSLLTELGFQVLEASEPQEALSIAETTRDPIDLLLTDCVMPRMSGREVARRVMSMRKETRCVLMTGMVDTQKALSPSDTLPMTIPMLKKPFTTVELEGALRSALG